MRRIPEWNTRGNPRGRNKRPRNKRKPNRKLLCWILCVTAVISCTVSFALQTPAFTVREVEIRGVRFADGAIVRQVVGDCLGQNILALRKGSVAKQIGALSQVEGVRIGRTFPAKVWVRIEEHKPDAALLCGNRYFLLSSDGLAFHCLRRPVKGLPVLHVAECRQVKVGRTCSSPGIGHALQVVGIARNRELTLVKISVDRAGDMCLNMGSGLYVKLGEPDELAEKMSKLRRVLLSSPSLAKDAAYINLSCPSACTVKYKTGV